MGALTLSALSVQGALGRVHDAVAEQRPEVFAFCNMHTFNLARHSPAFIKALSRCTVFNDGVGIDVAGRVLHGAPFPANLNGTDLTPAVLATSERPLAVYILGGKPGVAEEAARALEKSYPQVTVAGTYHGYFDASDGASVLKRIRSVRPNLVLVGMGNPRQEHWAVIAAPQLGCPIICVGAFIDFAAGRFPRAPRWIRNLRVEWLYRLALEPRRLAGRYLLGGFAFATAVLAERLRSAPAVPGEAQ